MRKVSQQSLWARARARNGVREISMEIGMAMDKSFARKRAST
jgi:hypothetical protein